MKSLLLTEKTEKILGSTRRIFPIAGISKNQTEKMLQLKLLWSKWVAGRLNKRLLQRLSKSLLLSHQQSSSGI